VKTSIGLLLALCACRAGDATPSPPGFEIAETPSLPVHASAQQASPDDAIAPPFTLTASDGSGLAVTRVDAKAVIEGPLAYTELHVSFRNPEPRVREGTFAITLPPGAAVERHETPRDLVLASARRHGVRAPARLTRAMGYGMGLLQIERFDGKSITVDDRPYVIMNDHAFVDLGSL
jgi:hypothetical protein